MHSILSFIAFQLALCLLFCIQLVEAKDPPYSGVVIAVSDGDTIKVLHDGIPEKIRLSDIDCPEKKQAFGARAKKLTADLCFGKQVRVVPVSRDRYGRTVAAVLLPDGRDLNRELVKAGYAWWYQKYSSNQAIQDLELTARAKHLGLWSESNPSAPWEFRQGSRVLSFKNGEL